MAQSKLVLNRNFTLATTKGHQIKFEKGVAIHVPPVAYAECLAIGAIPPDGEEPDVKGDPDASHEPMDPSERDPLIRKAIDALYERNDREDFTAAGHPTVGAVSAKTGWKVSSKEIGAVLQARNDELAAAE